MNCLFASVFSEDRADLELECGVGQVCHLFTIATTELINPVFVLRLNLGHVWGTFVTVDAVCSGSPCARAGKRHWWKEIITRPELSFVVCCPTMLAVAAVLMKDRLIHGFSLDQIMNRHLSRTLQYLK